MAENTNPLVRLLQLKGLMTGFLAKVKNLIMEATPFASATKAGLMKPGSGLQAEEDGTVKVVLDGIEVNPENIAKASKSGHGVVKVGNGLNVSEGTVSVDDQHIKALADAEAEKVFGEQEFKTVNGESIKGSGDITIDLSLYKVVETLPTANIDANKIYLVPNTTNVPDGEMNVYVEYMYVGSQWEKVGEYKTAIDLSPYATTTDLEKLQEIIEGDVAEGYISKTYDTEDDSFGALMNAWAQNVMERGVDDEKVMELFDNKFVSHQEAVSMTDAEVTAMLAELFPD